MTLKELKQKAGAEADKVIIGSGMDRASVAHLKHLLVTMYMQGTKENGIVWHKTGTPRENVLTIIEIENCGYLLCRYRNGFWYEDDSGAICAEFITNNILQWAEIPTV